MISSPTPLTMATGERIREIRHAEGLTQHDLAAALGVSVPVVSALERGVRLSVDRLVELARALQRSPAELLPDDPARLVMAEPATPSRAPLLYGDALVEALADGCRAFHAEHGRWPRKDDGDAERYVGEAGVWASWMACISRGGRGTRLYCVWSHFCWMVERGEVDHG